MIFDMQLVFKKNGDYYCYRKEIEVQKDRNGWLKVLVMGCGVGVDIF